ncbi:cellulose biosynthesis cyclic di-GMP-binding regulatory protein BcsB [Methylobacterium sp. Leaf106]|uniref:cellulose biosynthesis cyclic di-GMP-binding regulatory protein BcsB n=1 Tax=Methylobacterium sp. Leaf106 TaxID=1736255 RepID=UPI0007007681|nr:cellulose biosynthesis cyclic di-GMP-binding regulatory protein BcsB [Methylobacterium sp. Leaf106]KQP47166.1 cellulose synthase [Methylobacterium sp. Leaf106]
MQSVRILACLTALGLVVSTPESRAQSFLGSGPTERFSVPPVGDAMRRPEAPPPPRASPPPEEARRDTPAARIAPARRLAATTDGFRMEGEEATLRFPVYLTEAQTRGRPRLRISYLSAISVAPEASELTVSVNGAVVGRTSIQAPGAVKVVEFEIPEGSLKLGYNSVSLQASQRHRVDCSLNATYELWTQIDPSRSGLVIAPVAAASLELKDLPALEPDDSGALPVRVVANDKPNLPRLERMIHAVEAVGLIGRIARPVVEFGPPMTGRAGLNLIVGTAAELREMPDLESIGATGGPRLVVLPPRPDRAPTLVVSGTSYAEIEEAIASLARGGEVYGTPAGLKAASLARGTVMEGDETVSLQSLGVSTREFSGRLLRTAFDVYLPADFLPADYGKVMLNLAGAYASGLTSEARILVDLNGSNAASVPLAQTRGEVFENNTIPLPLARWRPGLNRVAIMAQVPTPADETCGLNATDSKRERFLILDRASLSIPTLARAARIPDLAATTSGALAFVKSERRPRLVLPTLDKDTVAAAATLAARLAGAAGRMIDFELAGDLQGGSSGPTLVVGPVRSLSPATLSGLGLDPDQIKSIWQARAETARAPGQSGSVPAPTLDRLRRNLPPRCSLPELILRPAPVSPPPVASAGETRRAPQARLSDGDLVTKWDETLRARHPLLEAADGVVERAGALVNSLVGDPRALFSAAPSTPATVTVPPGASLLMAQGFPSKAAVPSGFDGSVTVVTAPNALLLKASMACLVDPEVWSRIDGRFAFLDASDGSLETVGARNVDLIETKTRSLSNIRLVTAGWLSMNPAIYVALTLGLALLLGLTTTSLVRNIGRKNG